MKPSSLSAAWPRRGPLGGLLALLLLASAAPGRGPEALQGAGLPPGARPFTRVERLLGQLLGSDIESRVASWALVAILEDPDRGTPSPGTVDHPFDPAIHSFAGTNHGAPGAPGGFCAGISGLEAAVYEYAVRGRAPPADLLAAVPALGSILEAMAARGDPSLAHYMDSSDQARATAEAVALRLFTSQEPVLADRGRYSWPDPAELKRRIDRDGYCLLFFGTKYRKVSPWWNVLRRYYANGGHAMLFDGYRAVRVRNRDGVVGVADFFHAVDSNIDETQGAHPDFGLVNFRMRAPETRRDLWSWMGRPRGIELLALDAYQDGESYHSAAELLLPPVRFWERFLPGPLEPVAVPEAPPPGGDPAEAEAVLGQ